MKKCGNILIDGTYSKCNSETGNSFVYDLNPKYFNEVQSIFNPPSLSYYNIYLCQICESNSHYGYECSQRVPLAYEPEPYYNQIFGDNDYPHDSLEPEDSLRIGDKHLDIIPETESDEFLKSSVENLVSSPSESKDECKCNVPVCDDFTAFSNLLFDADDDFSSSDNKSFSDKDNPKEIYSNPLFDEEIISIKIDLYHFNAESDLIKSLLNQDSLIISSLKIESLLDEFADELILLKSILLGINEADCDPKKEIYLIEKLLYDNSSPRPPEEFILKILMLQSNLSLHLISSLRIVTLLGMRSIYLLLQMTRCHQALRMMIMTLKGIFLSVKKCLAINPFHFLKMSHFILIFHYPFALLRNHRMMVKLSPIQSF
nr:hypothetical protein [Tanacetum cinerariifolium]GEY30821.1 hypothetical protein [Tanacetum cinerariifolium]